MEIQNTITFKNPDTLGSLGKLWIEAEGWGIDKNSVSFSDLFHLAASRISYSPSIAFSPFDLQVIQPPTHDCALIGGRLSNTLYVYRTNRALAYSFKTSYGSLASISSVRSEETAFEEIFNFNIDKSATLSYPYIGNLNAVWQGSVYDAYGNIISSPSYQIQDGNIVLTQEVYGSLKVSYTLFRDVYDLSLAQSEDSDLFGGAVYAIYTGGISWLELDSPPEITPDLLDGDIECGYQWGNLTYDYSGLKELAPNIPTEAPKVDTKITTDYCTQEVMSVEQTYVGA